MLNDIIIRLLHHQVSSTTSTQFFHRIIIDRENRIRALSLTPTINNLLVELLVTVVKDEISLSN